MKKLLLLLGTLLISQLAFAIAEDELLPPEQAFSVNARAIDANTIEVEWKAAEGYYLYHDKFNFQSETPGIDLGTAQIPPGKKKFGLRADGTEGELEVYRHKVAITLPLKRSDAASQNSLRLSVGSQGCADVGVCYPPRRQTVLLNLPAATLVSKNVTGLQSLTSLGNSLGLGSAEREFLPPDEAFAFSAHINETGNIIADWQIAEGYYLYRDKFAFSTDSAGMQVGNVSLPAGEMHHGILPSGGEGDVEVYMHGVQVAVPVLRSNAAGKVINLTAKFQGCADAGICYPPMKKTVSLELPAGLASSSQGSASADTSSTVSSTKDEPVAEQDRLAHLLTNKPVLAVLLFFVFGIGLALTPCVFPMIPILSSIIVGQGEGITTRKAFTLSLVYVLAMAVTYTTGGIIAGMFGENLQAAFQNAWIISGFVGIFVVLSLSMFGFYDLQLPSALQSKLTEISNKQEGGTLIGVAIMGFLSALIVGPCVAAPLAGALLVIGQTGDPVLGGFALFSLSMGMGAPLLAIGVSAGKFLPRAGDWMKPIKAVFGVALLAVGIWMLERIIPAEVTNTLWAVLLIISAVYMGALSHLPVEADGWSKLWKGIGLVGLIYGVMLLIGVASGNTDMMQPLRSSNTVIMGGSATAMEHKVFDKVNNNAELDVAIKKASSEGKAVFLDFYADWCVECIRMEKSTFAKPEVQALFADMVLLKADVTDNNDEHKAMLKRFGLIGPPAMMVFGKDGMERRNYRMIGFYPPEEFVPHVRQALQ
ncbi:protein-disulfide reductase DsbD [Sulfuriflexus mobilis]|uniref:protein-disulfide reductase DsbD n=1 Tax=Sulfuriflexus mobilis TaxID=1811807 RepID=UPI000F81E72F|nr:protein-disulfide reductase DsbD [Sulfuriflexus mobilis]